LANKAQKMQIEATTAAVIATGEWVKLCQTSPSKKRRQAPGAFATTTPSTTGVDTAVTSA
jgi:hypothetical protein